MAHPRPTSRLTFREMTPDDLDPMADLLGSPEVMAFYPRPKTRAEALAWIAWNLGLYRDHGFGLWILELRDGGRFVGDCGLTRQEVGGRTEVEVGYHVVPALQGRGYATEAALAARDFARTVLGLDRIVAIVDPGNAASRRVAVKIGLAVEQEVEWAGKRVLVYAGRP